MRNRPFHDQPLAAPGLDIREGQTYRSCNPDDDGARIRVIGVSIASYWVTPGPGHGKVRVVPLDADGRPGRSRYVATSELHAHPTTALGLARRRGYALETDA
jgi:hypothetical protein